MKKLLIISAVIVLIFGLSSCSGNNSTASVPIKTATPITLTVPANVVSKIGAWKIQSGSNLNDLIEQNDWTDAYWESDGTLKIETTKEYCEKECKSIKEFFNDEKAKMLDKNESTYYVYYLSDVEVADDFSSITYIVDAAGYSNNTQHFGSSSEEIQMASAATYCMGLYQLYNNVSEYSGTVIIKDKATGDILNSFTWPEKTQFMMHLN